MNIIHVVPSVEMEASGPSYSVPSLTNAMNRRGETAKLVSTGSGHAKKDDVQLVFPRKRAPHRLGRSPEMYRWLRDQVSAGSAEIIHNHSIWMMPNVYPGWATRGTNVPLVISPRGTFSEWAMSRSRAVKFLFWHGLQKSAITHASLFHATADSEYDDIRRLGFRQPVAVLPNGVDIPEEVARDGAVRDKTLLFLSRVHPKKGVELLLRAWSGLQSSFPDWNLRIVGPGEAGYLAELEALATSLAADRVRFSGPLFGEEKLQVLRTASLFVLPTHSENFGMVVAEALAAGCPVITTRGAPWAGLEEQRSGWWIDIGVEPLSEALRKAMSLDPRELEQMGARGRLWMERDFSWDRIAARTIESYRWILKGGSAPAWIRND